MSQNYIQRNKLYNGICIIFTVFTKIKFLMTSYSKKLRMRNWDMRLESHGRLDKTMYGVSSLKVCQLRHVMYVMYMELFHCI